MPARMAAEISLARHRGDGQSIFHGEHVHGKFSIHIRGRGHHRGGPQAGRHLAGQLVGSAHVARGQRNGKLPPLVHHHHRRIRGLTLQPWRNGAHGNPRRPHKHQALRLFPCPPAPVRQAFHRLRPGLGRILCHTKRPGPRQSPPQIGREVCPPEGKGHNPNAHCFASRKPVVKAGWYSSDRL